MIPVLGMNSVMNLFRRCQLAGYALTRSLCTVAPHCLESLQRKIACGLVAITADAAQQRHVFSPSLSQQQAVVHVLVFSFEQKPNRVMLKELSAQVNVTEVQKVA